MADAHLFQVPGQVAVITGGGTGIGHMMATALASNGAHKVYILGRRLEKLQEAASSHDNIVPLQCDVTDKDSLASAAERVKSEVGYVNLLAVNSGSVGPMLESLPEDPSIQQLQKGMWSWASEDLNKVYALNNTAAFFSAVAFLELLDAGNAPGKGPDYHSQILFTASLAGLARKLTTGVAYATSKAAAVHLAKSMSTFLAGHKIRSNALCPGIFPSEMTEGHVGATAGFGVNTIPAGRLGSDEDVKGTILWLAGRAGAYVNGMVILLDGGRLSQQPAVY